MLNEKMLTEQTPFTEEESLDGGITRSGTGERSKVRIKKEPKKTVKEITEELVEKYGANLLNRADWFDIASEAKITSASIDQGMVDEADEKIRTRQESFNTSNRASRDSGVTVTSEEGLQKTKEKRTMQVKEEAARKLLTALGKSAGKWLPGKIEARLNDLENTLRGAKDLTDEEDSDLLKRISDAVMEGAEVEVLEENDEDVEDSNEETNGEEVPKKKGRPKQEKAPFKERPNKTTSKNYNEVESTLRLKKSAQGPLSVGEVKETLGWEEEPEGYTFARDFDLKDVNGKKVRINNRLTNRPFRISLAKRYKLEHLRNKWLFNGESKVIDWFGNVQDGQHSLTGFVLAEQEREKNPEHWKVYGWKGPLVMEALVVTGIDPKAADTLNLGLKRSLGDVLFRRDEFSEVLDHSEKLLKKLSNVLSVATRLAWLRCGGKTVSDAKHFPHSEALSFVHDHPRLKDAVEFIYAENGGRGSEGQKISSFITLGYAAGLLYLMGMSNSVTPSEMNDSNWEKACDFWKKFASGEGLERGDPILTLRNLLVKSEAGSGTGRDEIVSMVIKAWNLWITDSRADANAVKVKKKKDQDTGNMVAAENPRLGGLDVELPE